MNSLNINRFVLDADVLIASCSNYYAFEICPGFWKCLEDHFQRGHLILIDRVREEIQYPKELTDWVERVTDGSVESTASQAIAKVFGDMMFWVTSEKRFTEQAEQHFASNADGWLAAFALVNQAVLVTNEAPNPFKKKEVPLRAFVRNSVSKVSTHLICCGV